MDSITSFNESGKFDVFASHANFISLIQNALVISTSDGERKEIEVGLALLRVRNNDVEVYLGIEGMKEGQVKSSPDVIAGNK